MVEQAQARNAVAVESGHVDLRQGSVGNLPFDNNCFDKAVAINSMQVWPDAPSWIARDAAGHEAWRQNSAWLYALFGATESRTEGKIIAVGFTKHKVVETSRGFLRVGDKAISNMTHALRRLGNETEEWSCVDIARRCLLSSRYRLRSFLFELGEEFRELVDTAGRQWLAAI